MQRSEYGALPTRPDLVHTAATYYGMQRSPRDATAGVGPQGPSQEERDQQEAQQIVAMVRYASRGEGNNKVKAKCSNKQVLALVTGALTQEELGKASIC